MKNYVNFVERLLFAVVVVAPAGRAIADWTPPNGANAEQAHAIIREAIADARHGNYQDSLAKYVWYHSHSFEFDPGLLTDWYELAKVYPPAMVELKETREAEVQQVTNANGDVVRSFEDIASINKCFGDDARTASLFLQLDKKSPSLARKAYAYAQPALVKAKQYKVCGKYLERYVNKLCFEE